MCAWYGDRARHSKASKGIKTGRKRHTYNHINPTATKMWKNDRDFQLSYAKRILHIPNPEQYTTARLATIIERRENGFMYDVIGKKQLHELLNKASGNEKTIGRDPYPEPWDRNDRNKPLTHFTELPGAKYRDNETGKVYRTKKRKKFEEEADPIYRDYPYERRKPRKEKPTDEQMLLFYPEMFERNRIRSGNMTLTKKYLKQSIKDEKAANKSYLKHAKGKGNKFLKEIAKDERHHKKLLTKRLNKLNKNKK